jgi:acyl-coenzyme A synthetase/AMP-(fatty) acid ligase
VREAAVVGVAADAFEGTAICCAYASGDGELPAARVRESLRQALPAYMLPSRWLVLPELPKNANGKIDRRRLRELFERRRRPDAAPVRAEATDAG